MEYSEDDYLMLSGIQHFCFCKRQWALIHIEKQWADNVHTTVGNLMHKKTHDPYITEKRDDTIIVRAMPVSSRELGVSGECDVVEFHKCDDGISLHKHTGLYSIYPVEYKKGKPKITEEDIMQLVAESMCLEEMFSTVVTEAALYYGTTHHREIVTITDELRANVRKTFKEMHQYYGRGYTPKVKLKKACNSCSLRDVCVPRIQCNMSVKDYIEKALEDNDENTA